MQINKIRSEKEVTTDTTEIQRTIRDYYNQLYANKMNNLEEMAKILEKYNLPRLNQEEIKNMSTPITSTDRTCDEKNSQQTKVQHQMDSQEKSTIHLERSQPYPSETIPKNFRERNTSKLILSGGNHPDTKTRHNKKENYRQI